MPKRMFWPAALVIMGLVLVASNLGYLPSMFWNFWPLLLIIVGLGGLLISDKEAWDTAKPKKKATGRQTSKKKSARKKSKK